MKFASLLTVTFPALIVWPANNVTTVGVQVGAVGGVSASLPDVLPLPLGPFKILPGLFSLPDSSESAFVQETKKIDSAKTFSVKNNFFMFRFFIRLKIWSLKGKAIPRNNIPIRKLKTALNIA
jgi:hypothetical protein